MLPSATKAQLGQSLTDIGLVLRQMGHGLKPLRLPGGVDQAALDAPGQQVEEQLVQLPGVDGAPVGGKAYLQPQEHRPGGGVQGTGGALQHLLPAAADGDQAAVARAFRLARGPGGQVAKLSGEGVLKGDALGAARIQGRGEGRRLSAHPDAQPGGGGEGVPLDVVDGQDIAGELIGPPGVLIGGIAPPVNALEQRPKVVGCLHRRFLPCPVYYKPVLWSDATGEGAKVSFPAPPPGTPASARPEGSPGCPAPCRSDSQSRSRSWTVRPPPAAARIQRRR